MIHLEQDTRIKIGEIAKLLLSVTFLVLAGANAALADSPSVSPEDAIGFVGKSAQVCGAVVSATYATKSRGQPTFLNLDRAYPNHVFTAVIFGDDRGKFRYAPESLKGQRICVTGVVALYKGLPQIVVSDPDQIATR